MRYQTATENSWGRGIVEHDTFEQALLAAKDFSVMDPKAVVSICSIMPAIEGRRKVHIVSVQYWFDPAHSKQAGRE